MYMLQRGACGATFHLYFQHFEGLIHEGDELKEVNGVSLERRKPKEILPLLVSLSSILKSDFYTEIPQYCRQRPYIVTPLLFFYT